MIVSPPFLLPRTPNTTDEQWLALAMAETNSGRFPVSLHAAWHGGVHLEAPADAAGARLPVSAIADGDVVFVRAPVTQSTDLTHPQNYGSSAGPVWTDNGCVIVRHRTEMGMTRGRAPTEVTFFSIYMHLSAIDSAIQTPAATPAQRIFRKESVGTAGQVYGQNNILHFEVVCDDDNLARIAGRTIAPGAASPPDLTTGGGLPFSQNGRSDALFGARYFMVPAGGQIFSRSPVEYRVALDKAQQHAVATSQPIPTALPNAPVVTGTLAQAVLVSLECATGDATVTTTELNGTPISAPLVHAGLEYDILDKAIELARFVPLDNADNGNPAAPTPTVSTCQELIRLGQVIGPDALTPPTTPNWWQANLPGGQTGFIDLNSAGVFKYSDADFPQWKRWHFVDGTVNNDSRCDDSFVLSVLDADGNGVTETETDPANFSPDVVATLSRVVANFPTEWDANGLQARWAWLQTATPSNPTPLNVADFASFISHAQALCFWDAAVIGLGTTHWHFHPRQFLAQMRKSFWLSGFELAQCIPRRAAAGLTPWRTAERRGNLNATALSDMFRRFGVVSSERVMHIISQIILETAFLRTLAELGQGAGHTYAAFYGRGHMQLTHPENYASYGEYRRLPNHAGAYTDPRITATSTHPQSNPTRPPIRWSPRYDPNLLETDFFAAADSGGRYWVGKHYAGTHEINRVADLGLGGNIVGCISRLVNGGSNGYDARQEFIGFVINVLGDAPLRSGIEARRFPRLQSALHTFPPGTPANDRTVNVNHTPRQRP